MFFYRIIGALMLSSVLVGSALAKPSGLYRGRNEAFLDMQIPLSLSDAKKCILGQLYGAGIVSEAQRSLEVVDANKIGGISGELINWGKKIYESIDMVHKDGVTRVILNGSSIQQYSPTTGKLFQLYEPCMKANIASNDRKIVEPLYQKKEEVIFVVESKLSKYIVADCMTAYNRDTSSDYEAYYYNHQSTVNPNGSIHIGWYFGGSFNIAASKRFFTYFIEATPSGSKIGVANVYVGKNPTNELYAKSWNAQLASSCALDGTNKRVTGWPRGQYWTP